MSGGVDSSVAALLLQEEGYEVIGISMKLYDGSRCCTAEDVRVAKDTAAIGGFPLYTVNFKGIFEKEVVDYFVEGYLKGETPNPCVLCNQQVKFKALLKRAKELDAQFLATGHYARVVYDGSTERWLLKKAKDSEKDQSYFLATLSQEVLKHLRFPLGGYTKKEVREIARKKGLRFARKEESQDLCFISEEGYPSLLQKRATVPDAGIQEGEIVNSAGEVLGRHSGIANYTIGQRRGLGVAAGRPLYVTRLDPLENQVIVGEDRDLLKKELIAKDVNWIAKSPFISPFTKGGTETLTESITVSAKIRSRHEGAKARIEPLSTTGIPACEDSADPDLHARPSAGKVRVIFEEPQRAITPGQLVVFYQDDVVLGGGWIQGEKDSNGESL